MKSIGVSCCALLSVVFISSDAGAFLYSNSFSGSSLIDTNQAFESIPQAGLFLEQPASLSHLPKLAAVHFLTKENGVNFGVPEFNDPTVGTCQRKGYILTKCETEGTYPALLCPDNSSYFKTCCAEAYKNTSCTYPLTKSADSCGGKYKCICDTSLYPVTSCTSPQVVATGSGSSCTADGITRYSECVCPAAYSETCSGLNLQGKGTGCTKNGTTKYTACECKAGYNLTCSDLGPSKPTDYCQLNGIKYYNSCKTCPNVCTLASCPAGATCTYEECSKKYCSTCANKCKLASCPQGTVCEQEACSQKYCAIGCATGYVDWCVKPETDCAKLGYTKSASQCPDGYLKCPYNSAAVFCEDSEELSLPPAQPSGTKCADIEGCQECTSFNLNTNSDVCTKCASGYIPYNDICLKANVSLTCEYGYYEGGDICCTKAQSADCGDTGSNGTSKECKCVYKHN